MSIIKVVHYINQFYAGIGGEDKAGIPAFLQEGAVGPGLAFKNQFGDQAEIVATVVCGDSYFNENMDAAAAQILDWIKSLNADLLIAGPVFAARPVRSDTRLCRSQKRSDARSSQRRTAMTNFR